MTVQANKNSGSDERQSTNDPRVALLKQLVDPIRLQVVDRLAHAGPATVSRLAEELDVPMPQLSNHLRRLRDGGLVAGTRHGRQVTYELADPGLEMLTPLLDSITGRIHRSPTRSKPTVPSRTCYEHLAGPIGVGLYAALREHHVLRGNADGTIVLGPAAKTMLPRLGVDPELAPPGRQRFAFECLDATEHAPHLAGALGDALARSLTERGWIDRDPHSRRYQLTEIGRQELHNTLGFIGPTRDEE